MAKEKERIYSASEFALRNIIKDGLDDIFVTGRTKHWSDIIERELLQHPKLQQLLLASVREDLIGALNNQKSERPRCLIDFRKYQTPKRSGLYAYRHAALLEPKTTLGYNTLAILFAEAIERQRIPASENIVFSYRFSPETATGQLFAEDGETGFKGFLREERRRAAAPDTNYILSADIAHFYDTLNIHVLENQLRKAAEDDQFLSKRVTYWLDRFLQKTDTGWSRGIPVGNNGSRILAEASLISLDRRLKRRQINFIRYVDDFRIFASTPAEAQKALEILNVELDRIGLALNDSKVALNKISDALRKQGREILSGQDPALELSEYQDLIPMVYRRSKENKKPDDDYESRVSDIVNRYESGSSLSDIHEVKLLVRHSLESPEVKVQLNVISVLEEYLSFSKYICRGCVKSKYAKKLQKQLFLWFTSKIEHLPSHCVHALLEMFGEDADTRERALSEVLLNEVEAKQLDPFVFREALIAFRTSLTADDIEDLLQVLVQNNNHWILRGLAYCIWRGNQFSQKEKQVRLGRLAANHQDEFIHFLAKVRHADFGIGLQQ